MQDYIVIVQLEIRFEDSTREEIQSTWKQRVRDDLDELLEEGRIHQIIGD